MKEIGIVVLAAGMGTRMRSKLPKVLHAVANRSMLGHVLTAARALSPQRIAVVHGPGMDNVRKNALKFAADAVFAEQTDRKGTGHAVQMAAEAFKGFSGVVLVLYGDVPLVESADLKRLIEQVTASKPMAVLGFVTDTPKGYGRLLTKADNSIVAIREELDASPDEREIGLCNSGIIAIESQLLWKLLPKIGSKNAKGEIYLTDLVELVNKDGKQVGLETCSETSVLGVNDRAQLAGIEQLMQAKYRKRAMDGGATLIDPASVYFSADTVVGADVVIEPNVIFGPNVTVEDDVTILGHSHIEGARIGKGSRIGPFARLRPGADIAANAHIGNFVEIKNAEIAEGAKVNHLSYVGDASVGKASNIGAGTITCNYDGFEKHKTTIGENVFVGSNTALVAPVTVGDGANIAAGTVVTKSVPADALAVARPEFTIKDGWAKQYRALLAAKKAKKSKS
jgi:bifunctional UDP-N-acetylglucosamine pyrophosphorylase / glucosamine-1-phosphate N-acetyltransferase